MGFEAPQGLIGQIDETLAITDLNDVTDVTGTGTTVVFSVAPALTGTTTVVGITGSGAARFATLGVGVAVSGAEIFAFTGTGTVASAASAVWDAFHFNTATATLSGSTNITTATGFNFVTVNAPALSGTVTVTIGATVYIAGAPTISGGGAITTPLALWVDSGDVRLDGALLFVDNTTDIGASGATRPRTGYFGTALVVGTNPAAAGLIRLQNDNTINWRNAANNGDITALYVTSGNIVTLADGNVSCRVVGGSGGSLGFFGKSPAVQQTGIVDADGTLADVTSKFNSLLGKLETYGLLTVA